MSGRVQITHPVLGVVAEVGPSAVHTWARAGWVPVQVPARAPVRVPGRGHRRVATTSSRPPASGVQVGPVAGSPTTTDPKE